MRFLSWLHWPLFLIFAFFAVWFSTSSQNKVFAQSNLSVDYFQVQKMIKLKTYELSKVKASGKSTGTINV